MIDCNLLVIIGIMTFGGFFGGVVNYFQSMNEGNSGGKRFWTCIVVGLGASYLVPLFLKMISSNLIENSRANSKELLVLYGFCLIAAIFSRRFIKTIGDRILKEVRETKKEMEEAKDKVVEAGMKNKGAEVIIRNQVKIIQTMQKSIKKAIEKLKEIPDGNQKY